MMSDIIAIQRLYGASTSTRSGDTVYGNFSTADNPLYDATTYPGVAVTIFDTGGNGTFNYSLFSTNQTINLESETFSNVASGVGNLAIARGVVIENAIGGSDTLLGNSAGNRLTGGQGNDTLAARAGNDTLSGGAGRDDLNGGLGADSMAGGADSDVFTVNHAGDIVSEVGGEGNADMVR